MPKKRYDYSDMIVDLLKRIADLETVVIKINRDIRACITCDQFVAGRCGITQYQTGDYNVCEQYRKKQHLM